MIDKILTIRDIVVIMMQVISHHEICQYPPSGERGRTSSTPETYLAKPEKVIS